MKCYTRRPSEGEGTRSRLPYRRYDTLRWAAKRSRQSSSASSTCRKTPPLSCALNFQNLQKGALPLVRTAVAPHHLCCGSFSSPFPFGRGEVTIVTSWREVWTSLSTFCSRKLPSVACKVCMARSINLLFFLKCSMSNFCLLPLKMLRLADLSSYRNQWLSVTMDPAVTRFQIYEFET
jgi:hypothetical protein